MKVIKKSAKALFLLICFVALLSLPAFAADGNPTPVTKVAKFTGSVEGRTATFTWEKNTTASSYAICLVDSEGKELKVAKKVAGTATKATITGLTKGKKYSYRIRAIGADGTKGSLSKLTVSFVVPKRTVKAPTGFTLSKVNSKSVEVYWNKVSGVDGYTVFSYNSSTKTYRPIATFGKSTTSGVVPRLNASTNYKLYIKSYYLIGNQKVYSPLSEQIRVKIETEKSRLSTVRAPRYVCTAKKKIVAKDSTTGKSVTIKSGTVFAVDSKTSTKVKGYLSNGRVVILYRSNVNITGLDSKAEKDYTKRTKELYVNGKGLSSQTNWLIWVSEYKFKVNIFKGSKGKWVLQKVYPCCSGSVATRTASGVRKILKKVEHGMYGPPHLWFSPGIDAGGTNENPQGCAFHYYTSSARNAAVSHGCVRTEVEALYYMYNNIPVGTTVYVR